MQFSWIARANPTFAAGMACRVAATLVLAVLPVAAQPQTSGAASDERPAVRRPITREQGQAILNAAWAHRKEQSAEHPDCSHLVHDVYLEAGLEYPYTPSTDLYDGVPDFERVREPQPGDLIVWPGHVGIVVDPAAHSFYSSQRTGLKLDFYDDPAWWRQDPPHFFRYLGATTSTAERKITTAATHDGEVSVEEHATAATARATEPESDAEADPTLAEAHKRGQAFEYHVVVVHASSPTKQAVADAVERVVRANAEAMTGRKPLNVAVIDHAKVKRVKVSGSHAAADVQLSIRAFLSNRGAEMRKSRANVRVQLTRANHTWRVDPSFAAAFVTRDVAVAELSSRLAELSRTNAPQPEQQRLVKMLALLVKE